MEPTTFQIIDKFIADMDKTKRLDEILEILKFQVQRIGFERFTYWLLWPPEGPRKPLYLTSYPADWTAHYNESDYKSYDILASHSAASFRPFLWSSVPRGNLTKTQKAIFHDAIDFGLRAGGNVPLHGPGKARATFTVSNNCTEEEFAKLFLARRHELQLLASYAHEKILQLGLDRIPVGSKKLTPREIEVLTWAARGKTQWEIGEILRISELTAKTHLANICLKLEASNTAHATAVGIIHSIIIP